MWPHNVPHVLVGMQEGEGKFHACELLEVESKMIVINGSLFFHATRHLDLFAFRFDKSVDF